MLMPALVLGFANAAPLMRYTRASMLEVLGSEYVTTARSKGLRGRIVLVRHGLRNALIPIITVVGLLLPELVAGAIITEQVFSWPGMGLLAVRAASQRDPSLMMGIVLLISVAVLSPTSSPTSRTPTSTRGSALQAADAARDPAARPEPAVPSQIAIAPHESLLRCRAAPLPPPSAGVVRHGHRRGDRRDRDHRAASCSPTRTSPTSRRQPPAPPAAAHLLGTDTSGRDVLARVVLGRADVADRRLRRGGRLHRDRHA